MAGGSFRVNSRVYTKNAQAESKRIRAEVCPYCGSSWTEPYGVSSRRCRNCLVKFGVKLLGEAVPLPSP